MKTTPVDKDDARKKAMEVAEKMFGNVPGLSVFYHLSVDKKKR